WFRAHPEEIPTGVATNQRTSWQIRSDLKKQGWDVTETQEEVRLLPPEVIGDADIISVVGESDEDEVGDVQEEPSFALESHLRDFIAQNISTLPLGQKKLRLYVDESGRRGVEYPTAVGPIDILAVDDDGTFYVFELKL